VRQTNLRARVAVLLAASLPVALAVVPACSDNAGPAGVADVAITPPSSTTVVLRSTLVLTASARDAGGDELTDRVITWTSGRNDVVTVRSTGPHTALVTAVGGGAAVVTASSEHASDTVTISVRLTAGSPVASVSIIPPTAAALDAGGDLALVAVAKDSSDRVLTGVGISWSSSDTSAASVTSTGLTTARVVGRAPGAVTISAAVNGQTAAIVLTIRPAPVTTVRIDPPSLGTLSLPPDQSIFLQATVLDLLGHAVVRPVTWSSSNPAVATVDPVAGSFTTVSAKATGSTTIVASADGISGSLTVNVPATRHAFLWTAAGGMTDLGSLPGFSASDAYAVNASGDVVGTLSGSGRTGAFRWSQAGGMQALAGLPGGTNSGAAGINASGQIVGVADNRAVLWSPAGAIRDLGTLPGGVGSAATAINDLGQVVGYSYSATGFSHAFLWTEAGGMQDLGPTLARSSASDNSLTQVVGSSDNALFRWTPGEGMQLLPIPSGTTAVAAGAVNDAGVIVGTVASATNPNCSGYYCYYYSYSTSNRSIQWDATGQILDLNALPGFATDDNQAFGINNDGQVVGRNQRHGYRWSQATGLVDVSVLPGRSFSTAVAINDNGQVVGSSW
jgi:probable HAF family extracellular repeat protein